MCRSSPIGTVGIRLFHTKNKFTYLRLPNDDLFANGNNVHVVGDLVRRT